jgi:hypothetical protein
MGMPETTDLLPTSDPIYARLQEQIDWYDRKGSSAQRTFKRIKVAEILAAAVIPFLAGITIPHDKLIIAGLGVMITILEGFLHLNQYQQLWGTYRGTCEALKHEKYVYLAKAGPYATAADAHALLAERVESLVSQEHAQWNSFQQQAGKSDSKE